MQYEYELRPDSADKNVAAVYVVSGGEAASRPAPSGELLKALTVLPAAAQEVARQLIVEGFQAVVRK